MEIYLDDLKPDVARDILNCEGFSQEDIERLLETPVDVAVGYIESEAFDELYDTLHEEEADDCEEDDD